MACLSVALLLALCGVVGIRAESLSYTTGAWSRCSSSCGIGVQIRSVSCIRDPGDGSSPEVIASARCRRSQLQIVRPDTHQICNFDVLCPAELTYVHDRPCSHSCGGGVISARPVCRRKNNAGRYDPLPLTECRNASRPSYNLARPIPCNTDVQCPPLYEFGDWGHCSSSCGQGTRSRRVRCFHRRQGRVLRAELNKCLTELGHKPHTQSCNLGVCRDNYKWRSTDWSMCSVRCEKTRIVKCYSAKDGRFVEEKECAHEERPAELSRCINMGTLLWNVSDWNKCSTTFGECTQQRQVTCVDSRTGKEARSCAHCLKPSEYTRCHPRFCSGQRQSGSAGTGTCTTDSTCPQAMFDKASDNAAKTLCSLKTYEFICCGVCAARGF